MRNIAVSSSNNSLKLDTPTYTERIDFRLRAGCRGNITCNYTVQYRRVPLFLKNRVINREKIEKLIYKPVSYLIFASRKDRNLNSLHRFANFLFFLSFTKLSIIY